MKNIGIIGLGALGTMYGDFFSHHQDQCNVYVIADQKRIDKYQKEQVYCNDRQCTFNYLDEKNDQHIKMDLLFFCVKIHHLETAIQMAKPYVADHTIILSTLNGIVSEEIIRASLPQATVLYCVALGMDAVKAGNQMHYKNMGQLSFGNQYNSEKEPEVLVVEELFNRCQMPYEVPERMENTLWGKFMFNVGINQASAVLRATYGEFQQEGQARTLLFDAMKEVIKVAEKMKKDLSEADLEYWEKILDKLNPMGKTSMLQDVLAKRQTEVDLFAKTVIDYADKYGLEVPVNQMLYEKIKTIEKNY